MRSVYISQDDGGDFNYTNSMILPFLFLLMFVSGSAEAQVDLCDVLNLNNCRGVTKQGRRSSLNSLPSPSTSASINPATVSLDKGIGVEALAQANNPVRFSLASGTGKIGAILISSHVENTFFGNRVVELDGVFFNRRENDEQYESKKLSFATAASLLRKNKYALDVGIILKRHSEIKRINPGAGISGRFGPLTLAASVYQDDFILKREDALEFPTGTGYENEITDEEYTEKFTVQTFSGGIRFRSLSLDAGIIKTRYKFHEEDTVIRLISASYTFRNFLFNVASRNEVSPFLKYEDGEMVVKESQQSLYGGIQVSMGKHLILGVHHNYFLLDEMSFSGTLFF